MKKNLVVKIKLAYLCMYNNCKYMKKKYFQAIYQIITSGHWITDRVSMELKEFGFTEPQYNV